MKTVLTENILRNIIKESIIECIQSTVLESITPKTIGSNGPISPGDLIKPEDIDAGRDFNRERDEYCNKVHRRMFDDEMEKVFGDSEWFKIWKQYKTAMLRPNDPSKQARGFFGFVEQIKHGKAGMPIRIFKYNNSYILGMLRLLNFGKDGYALFFWPAYFAPATMREGYMSVAELSKYNNIIFTVTDDLAKMLKKLGLYEMPDKFKMKFRGHVVDKELYSTSELIMDPVVSKLIAAMFNQMAGV